MHIVNLPKLISELDLLDDITLGHVSYGFDSETANDIRKVTRIGRSSGLEGPLASPLQSMTLLSRLPFWGFVYPM